MNSHYDLHTHSRASDGILDPAELAQRAHAHGVRVLALTDHDTTAGLASAKVAAAELGLALIPGIEISVTWNHQTVHIVGLNIDPHYAALQKGIAKLCEFRQWRAQEMGRRLEKRGIKGAYAGAMALAGGVPISRTHFARYFVAQGYAPSMQAVFKRYLIRNKPGFVPGQWATLDQAVDWIHGAGGQAVIAHPLRYKFTATRMRRLLGEFSELGAKGIEVTSSSSQRNECRHIAKLADTHNLMASCGSDFHDPGNPYIELGRSLSLPHGCVPIWEDWPALPLRDSHPR